MDRTAVWTARFSDWRVFYGVDYRIYAKEAVVSTLSVLTGTATANLSRVRGSMFTGRSAASFLVFTLLYTAGGCSHCGGEA